MRSLCANACGYVANKIIEFTYWLQKMKETNSGTDVSKKLPLRSRIGAIILSPTDNLVLFGWGGVCASFICLVLAVLGSQS